MGMGLPPRLASLRIPVGSYDNFLRSRAVSRRGMSAVLGKWFNDFAGGLPVARNEGLSFLPPLFDHRRLEGRIAPKVRVVGNDHLKIRRQLGDDLADDPQHACDLQAIVLRHCIGFRFGLRVEIQWEIDLRRLVEEQESRHWALRFPELRVQGEMRGKVIGEPVFTATDED